MVVLQYLLLDCDESYKPDETNELYKNEKKREFNSVLLDGEY
jgi:hypothetical protein